MLLILRALFGVGMGGEWGLGAALALESVPPKARGIVSGILQQGYAVGYLLAAVLFWTLYDRIGWRGMFVVGVIPALLVLYLRISVKESPVFEKVQATRGGFVASLRASMQGRWPLFIYVVVLMTCFNSFSMDRRISFLPSCGRNIISIANGWRDHGFRQYRSDRRWRPVRCAVGTGGAQADHRHLGSFGIARRLGLRSG